MQTLYFQDVEVGKRYGVSRATIWRWSKTDPTFPKPISFSYGCSRWLLADLEKWEKSKTLAA
jgi:prophage regulatory protein